MVTCSQCGGHHSESIKCSCKLIGRAWFPEFDQTIEDSRAVWSRQDDVCLGLERWVAQEDANSAGELFGRYDRIEVAYQPVKKGAEACTYEVIREFDPVYYIEQKSRSK